MPIAIGRSGGNWGQIAGTLSSQTDLNNALSAKAALASPVFTGTPTAPTAAQGTNTTQLATCAGVLAEIAASGRLRFGSGVPSNSLGADGDGYVRTDAPYAGVLYLKAAGAWSLAQGTYTWAGRPSAASNSGAVITISDWNTDFYSDGTNWIPIPKRVRVDSMNASTYPSRTTGTGAAAVVRSFTIPSGLLIAGCYLRIRWVMDWAGTSASTKTLVLDDTLSGTFWVNQSSLAAGTKLHSDTKGVRFGATNLAFALPSGQAAESSPAAGLTSAVVTATAVNFLGNASLWRLRSNTASDDSFQLIDWDMTIEYV